MHIAIAGNIGAGKTSLTKLLSKYYKFEGHYEDVLKNPYLDKQILLKLIHRYY